MESEIIPTNRALYTNVSLYSAPPLFFFNILLVLHEKIYGSSPRIILREFPKSECLNCLHKQNVVSSVVY